MNSTRRYDAVLVPLDGSRLAAQALPPAASFAREAGCKLLLLHVLRVEVPVAAGEPPGFNPARERQVKQTQMDAYLHGLARGLADFGIEIETRILEGDPAETILSAARDSGRVMLVLTDSGMTAARGGVDPYEKGRIYAQIAAGWTGPLLLVT